MSDERHDGQTSVAPPPGTGRGSSVTLRETGAAAEPYTSLMDPAHKALAEALRVTYLLVKLAIVVLLILFVFSGVQRVNTGERGISLRFGKVVADDLKPGPHFSWPYPIGELIKVPTGNINTEIDFLPELSKQQMKDLEDKGATALAGTGPQELSPETDQYLLTADGSIGHTRWQLTYRRADPAKTLRTIVPQDLNDIVTAVVRRAIVHTAATRTIDELYRGIPDPSRAPGTYRSMEDVARERAQRTLDDMGSGLEIVQMSLNTRMPPRRVIASFDSVTKAVEDAGKTRSEAVAARETKLTSTAGAAAEPILTEIERYETQLATSDKDGAAATLEAIDRLMQEQPVTIVGKRINPRVSGRVATIIQQAEQERSRVVSEAQTDASLFVAKLKSFRANPIVTIHSDWADAMTALLMRQNVQSMLVNASGKIVLQLNRDPEIANKIERERRGKEAEEAQKKRQEQALREQFEKTDTGPSMRQ